MLLFVTYMHISLFLFIAYEGRCKHIKFSEVLTHEKKNEYNSFFV